MTDCLVTSFTSSAMQLTKHHSTTPTGYKYLTILYTHKKLCVGRQTVPQETVA